MTDSTPSNSLPHSRRLHGRDDFANVFAGQMRKPSGPIVFWAIPNTLGHPRMGLSVSRRIGNAVKRNRIKRMLREAYRTTQHDWPAGYDLVLAVRPHEPLMLEEYQFIFKQAMTAVHQQWTKRQKKAAAQQDSPKADEPA